LISWEKTLSVIRKGLFLSMLEAKQILVEQDELARILSRMAHEALERTSQAGELVLIGIRSRGAHLARRLARKIHTLAGTTPAVGIIDIRRYRDDRPYDPSAAETEPFEVPVSVDDKTVILVDDVIFRGRTIRAAMEAVARLGQPKRILVAVLIDRGARELPIRADIVGKNIEAGERERVNVMLEESDGIDQVALVRWQVNSAG
jgi:pyrimidine operon attenuation protein / uracil phosphoribosyltransferase